MKIEWKDIPEELNMIEMCILIELEKDVSTISLVMHQLTDYLDYLNESYNNQRDIYRPCYIEEYINYKEVF